MDRWINRYDAIPTHVNTVKVFNHVYAEEKRKFYGKEKSMLSRVSCDEGIKQELKREYSLSRSRLRKISSYQPTECPGINSSNGRKVWSIIRSNVRRTPVRLWSRSDRGWYSLTSEEEPRNEAIVARPSVTNFHYPSLGPSSTFSSNPLFFEEWKRAREEESSRYSVVEYLFAPIELLREASTVVEGTRDESDSRKSRLWLAMETVWLG